MPFVGNFKGLPDSSLVIEGEQTKLSVEENVFRVGRPPQFIVVIKNSFTRKSFSVVASQVHIATQFIEMIKISVTDQCSATGPRCNCERSAEGNINGKF